MNYLKYLLLFVLSLGGSLLQAQESRLAPGNTFSLRISGVPNEDAVQVSGTYTISSGGTVKLTYLNEINAVGLTPTELQRKIESAYKNGEIYTHPNVIVMTNNNFTTEMMVTVGGEVRQAGEVPIRPGLNIYAAISKCGGPTEYAAMKKVKLIRGGKEMIYDMRKITTANNPEVIAGDQIVVPGG